MPQDELKTSRGGKDTRKEVTLSKRDFLDLELVRRRLQDATLLADGQGQIMICLPHYEAVFVLGTVTTLLEACDLEE